MFGWKKRSPADLVDEVRGLRTDVLAMVREVCKLRVELEKIKIPPATPPKSVVEQWLPVLDRFQELALVAQGHADLAQQFGIATRQKEAAAGAETKWEVPDEAGEVEGMVYG